jgi:predicted phage tail protein
MTILENDQIASELAFQAKQTLEMMELDKRLQAENIDLKRRMELMVQLEKELSRKNTAAHKATKNLSSKIQDLEMELHQITRKMEHDVDALQSELVWRQERIDMLEAQIGNKLQVINVPGFA